jgi:hypothetical protein
MPRLAKVVAVASAFSAILVGLTVWGLGGPAEAYAIARIDGFQVVPIFPIYGTCYPPGFTSTKYRQVSNGDTPDAVRGLLGDPLSIMWSLDDEVMGKYLWFEPVGSQWRSSYAHELDVPKGTPMSSLAALRGDVVGETWSYSRSCIRDDSRRVRWVSFRHGRVDGLASGIYYD